MDFSTVFMGCLALPDVSLLLPTTLSNGPGGGGGGGRGGEFSDLSPLTHEPFALTTSDLVGY